MYLGMFLITFWLQLIVVAAILLVTSIPMRMLWLKKTTSMFTISLYNWGLDCQNNTTLDDVIKTAYSKKS